MGGAGESREYWANLIIEKAQQIDTRSILSIFIGLIDGFAVAPNTEKIEEKGDPLKDRLLSAEMSD
jgi:hypothetical protein